MENKAFSNNDETNVNNNVNGDDAFTTDTKANKNVDGSSTEGNTNNKASTTPDEARNNQTNRARLPTSASEPILKRRDGADSGTDSGNSSYSGEEGQRVRNGRRKSSVTIVEDAEYKKRGVKEKSEGTISEINEAGDGDAEENLRNKAQEDGDPPMLFTGSRALRLSTWEGTRMYESSMVPESLPPYPYNNTNMYEEPETFSAKIAVYMKSHKGRDLTLSMSLGYAMCLAVFCFAIVMSGMFSDDLIGNSVIQTFMGTMYSLSILSLVVLLVLGSFGRLTTDNHYMHQKSTAFIRGGMLALGTGGILYRFTIVGSYVVSEEECRNDSYLIVSILGIVFTLLQMAFLMKYSKIEINKSLGLGIAARFLTMQIVATNLCLWVNIIIEETAHELHYTRNVTLDEVPDEGNQSFLRSQQMDPGAVAAEGRGAFRQNTNFSVDHISTSRRLLALENGSRCTIQQDVQELLAPYLFALMIEFCVVASTMVIAIWEKAGQGIEEEEFPDMEGGFRNRALSVSTEQTEIMSSSRETDSDTSETPASARFYSSHLGFMAGWIVIICVFAVTVFSLYAIFAEAEFLDVIDETVYGTSLLVAVCGVVVIPPTMYKMSQLTFKDREISLMQSGRGKKDHGGTVHKNLDRHLLSVTFIAVMVYRVFCIIASVSQDNVVSGDEDEMVMLADSIVIIIMAGMQTMFCNWFAFQKRSTTERNLREKPGKQGLEFLRLLNFALWFLNSFLLKNPEAKEDQIQVFGETAWVILANVFHPLAILFYFHSFICVAEIMHRSYTKKYIGLVRMSKQRRYSQAAARKNTANLMQAESKM